MLSIEPSRRYVRSLKRCHKRGYDLRKLEKMAAAQTAAIELSTDQAVSPLPLKTDRLTERTTT